MYLTYSTQAHYSAQTSTTLHFTSLPSLTHSLTHQTPTPQPSQPSHLIISYLTLPYLASFYLSFFPALRHPPSTPKKKQEMSTPPLLRRRTIILTIGAVAITAVGAYTGAQLKSDLQAQRQKEISGEGIDGRIRR